jgi:regulator of cell morphogenesis and NO signaling
MSNPTLSPDRTLNELVALEPRLLLVLNAHGLDTCCGGAHTLREAARRHDLDLAALLAALDAAQAGA